MFPAFARDISTKSFDDTPSALDADEPFYVIVIILSTDVGLQ
jgi:hypothetical protein